MHLSSIVVDDEPLARACIAEYVSEIDFLNLTGMCSNPVELGALLIEQEIDLIFLDIQMPKMTGIDFLKMTHKLPMVILTTAYPSYALEGYQLDVLDYLLKPITFKRFFQAANKAREYHQLIHQGVGEGRSAPEYFFVKCENKFEKIFISEIRYIQAMQNYVIIYTDRGKHITLLPLKKVSQKLDNQLFKQTHKSYIVAVEKIDSIENSEILMQGDRIPVSRTYRESLMNHVIGERLWKK